MAGDDVSMRNLLQLYPQAGRSAEGNRKNSVDQFGSGKTQGIISKSEFPNSSNTSIELFPVSSRIQ